MCIRRTTHSSAHKFAYHFFTCSLSHRPVHPSARLSVHQPFAHKPVHSLNTQPAHNSTHMHISQQPAIPIAHPHDMPAPLYMHSLVSMLTGLPAIPSVCLPFQESACQHTGSPAILLAHQSALTCPHFCPFTCPPANQLSRRPTIYQPTYMLVPMSMLNPLITFCFHSWTLYCYQYSISTVSY